MAVTHAGANHAVVIHAARVAIFYAGIVVPPSRKMFLCSFRRVIQYRLTLLPGLSAVAAAAADSAAVI